MPIYRGRVVDFDSGTHTATVRLDGSAAQVLADVPTARNIDATEMTAGRRVLLDTGDHGELTDTVLFAVYTP